MFVVHKLLDEQQHIDKIHSYRNEFFSFELSKQLKHQEKNHRYYHLLLQIYSKEKKNFILQIKIKNTLEINDSIKVPL
jgi:hypothetical protein